MRFSHAYLLLAGSAFILTTASDISPAASGLIRRWDHLAELKKFLGIHDTPSEGELECTSDPEWRKHGMFCAHAGPNFPKYEPEPEPAPVPVPVPAPVPVPVLPPLPKPTPTLEPTAEPSPLLSLHTSEHWQSMSDSSVFSSASVLKPSTSYMSPRSSSSSVTTDEVAAEHSTPITSGSTPASTLTGAPNTVEDVTPSTKSVPSTLMSSTSHSDILYGNLALATSGLKSASIFITDKSLSSDVIAKFPSETNRAVLDSKPTSSVLGSAQLKTSELSSANTVPTIKPDAAWFSLTSLRLSTVSPAGISLPLSTAILGPALAPASKLPLTNDDQQLRASGSDQGSSPVSGAGMGNSDASPASPHDPLEGQDDVNGVRKYTRPPGKPETWSVKDRIKFYSQLCVPTSQISAKPASLVEVKPAQIPLLDKTELQFCDEVEERLFDKADDAAEAVEEAAAEAAATAVKPTAELGLDAPGGNGPPEMSGGLSLGEGPIGDPVNQSLEPGEDDLVTSIPGSMSAVARGERRFRKDVRKLEKVVYRTIEERTLSPLDARYVNKLLYGKGCSQDYAEALPDHELSFTDLEAREVYCAREGVTELAAMPDVPYDLPLGMKWIYGTKAEYGDYLPYVIRVNELMGRPALLRAIKEHPFVAGNELEFVNFTPKVLAFATLTGAVVTPRVTTKAGFFFHLWLKFGKPKGNPSIVEHVSMLRFLKSIVKKKTVWGAAAGGGIIGGIGGFYHSMHEKHKKEQEEKGVYVPSWEEPIKMNQGPWISTTVVETLAVSGEVIVKTVVSSLQYYPALSNAMKSNAMLSMAPVKWATAETTGNPFATESGSPMGIDDLVAYMKTAVASIRSEVAIRSLEYASTARPASTTVSVAASTSAPMATGVAATAATLMPVLTSTGFKTSFTPVNPLETSSPGSPASWSPASSAVKWSTWMTSASDSNSNWPLTSSALGASLLEPIRLSSSGPTALSSSAPTSRQRRPAFWHLGHSTAVALALSSNTVSIMRNYPPPMRTRSSTVWPSVVMESSSAVSVSSEPSPSFTLLPALKLGSALATDISVSVSLTASPTSTGLDVQTVTLVAYPSGNVTSRRRTRRPFGRPQSSP